MGGIYLITCTVTNHRYIGQTKHMQHRIAEHKQTANKLATARANGEKTMVDNHVMYNAMLEHGIDNFTFETIVDDVDEDELDALEIHYIEEYKTLKPDGFNTHRGGCYTKRDKDALPKDGHDLPKYVVLHCKGDSRGFAVCRHPLCDYNSFTLKEYATLEHCKDAAKKFLISLEANGVKYVHKSRPDLPIGITVFGSGYLAKRKVDGVLHKRAFGGAKVADNVKLQRALDYLATLPVQS